MSTAQRPRWSVSASLVVHRRGGEPGAIAFDHATGQSWRVSDATAHLVDALRAGWTPANGAPAPLLAMLPEGAEPPSTDDLAAAVADLHTHGLVRAGDAEAPAAPDAATTAAVEWHGWHDLRLRVARVAPPPARWRPSVARAALLAPPLALLVVVGALAVLAADGGAARALGGAGTTWALSLASLLLFAPVHELGHAVVLAAATGAPVAVGLRLRYGIPQAYADAARVVTLPARRDRLAVLCGGLAVELLLWGVLALALRALGPAAPALLRATVLVGGPGAAALNLAPFFRSDGYYVLQELARLDHLADAGRRSLRALAAGAEPGAASGPWWLPWYGLLDLVVAPLAIAVALVAVGVQLGAPGAGALAAFAAAGVVAWWRLVPRRGAPRPA